MEHCVATKNNDDSPVLGDTSRFLLGLLVLLAGLYIALLTDVRGNGLGFLLVLSAPFLILKDGE